MELPFLIKQPWRRSSPPLWITEAKEVSLKEDQGLVKDPCGACFSYSEKTTNPSHPLAFAGIEILDKDAFGITNTASLLATFIPIDYT